MLDLLTTLAQQVDNRGEMLRLLRNSSDPQLELLTVILAEAHEQARAELARRKEKAIAANPPPQDE